MTIRHDRSTLPQTPAASFSADISPINRVCLQVQGMDGHTQTLEFAGATEVEAVRRAVSPGFGVLSIESMADPRLR